MIDPLPILFAGAIAIGALVLLWMLVRHLQGRTRTLPASPALWEGRDYPCPDCGARMEPGWLLLGKGAIWSPRDRGQPGTFAHIGQALPNTISLSLKPACNMGWRCTDCQLLLVDHSKLVKTAG